MPSHLTRQVFRRLLANEPIVHRGCLRRQSYSTSSRHASFTRRPTIHNGVRLVPSQQTRTLFNFNMFAKDRDVREADFEPGIEEMMGLTRRQTMRARLPEPKHIAEAFRTLFEAKKRNGRSLPDREAQLALKSLEYVLEHDHDAASEGENVETMLVNEDLLTAAHVLQRASSDASEAHVALARTLWKLAVSLKDASTTASCLCTYVTCLSRIGSSENARDLLVSQGEGPGVAESTTATSSEDKIGVSEVKDQSKIKDEFAAAWIAILEGFARIGNEREILRSFDMIKELRPNTRQQLYFTRRILLFYIKSNDASSINQWWTAYRDLVFRIQGKSSWKTSKEFGEDIQKVLIWCAAAKQLETGHGIVRDVMDKNPSKYIWDAVFVWAASTGKGADEIDRMIEVMEKSSQDISEGQVPRYADSDTINALVEFAISKNDPYMAERFVSLGRDRGIQPTAKTLVLQMEYRLGVKDVDGALIAYKNLQDMDRTSNEDLSVVNRLIVALCNTHQHDFNTIMNVAADLSDRKTRFEPRTVQALTLLHLSRGEKDDVIDLLNTHAFHYSTTERDSIRDAILDFISEPKNSTGLAWEAYNIIKTTFDETPRAERTKIMMTFFDRQRPDMASNVFIHMRQHTRETHVPDVDTYVSAFMGAAQVGDDDCVNIIHNQLKLDFTVTATTKLLNSLMIAYTASRRSRFALTFWEDIVTSREGPSYNSLHIVLRACENSPFGDKAAQEIWALLRRRGVDLDNSLWASYIAALAGNGDNALAIGALETAFDEGKLEVDPFLLASLYMAAPGEVKQSEIAEWATQKFPGLWAEVEKMGFRDINEWSTAKIVVGVDRTVTP